MSRTSTLTTSRPERPSFEPRVAVAKFLDNMKTAAGRAYPAWQKTLVEGLEDCRLAYDIRHAVLEQHPIDDYFLAGVIALEASKVRQLFSPEESSELLSLIGEQVDAVAGRSDRVVSDLVFSIVGQVERATGPDKLKKPYDQVVKSILQRLGIDQHDSTKHLMTELVYRHSLGEPLALGVPHWWNTFHAKYNLTPKLAAVPSNNYELDQVRLVTRNQPMVRAKVRKRAVAF